MLSYRTPSIPSTVFAYSAMNCVGTYSIGSSLLRICFAISAVISRRTSWLTATDSVEIASANGLMRENADKSATVSCSCGWNLPNVTISNIPARTSCSAVSSLSARYSSLMPAGLILPARASRPGGAPMSLGAKPLPLWHILARYKLSFGDTDTHSTEKSIRSLTLRIVDVVSISAFYMPRKLRPTMSTENC